MSSKPHKSALILTLSLLTWCFVKLPHQVNHRLLSCHLYHVTWYVLLLRLRSIFGDASVLCYVCVKYLQITYLTADSFTGHKSKPICVYEFFFFARQGSGQRARPARPTFFRDVVTLLSGGLCSLGSAETLGRRELWSGGLQNVTAMGMLRGSRE